MAVAMERVSPFRHFFQSKAGISSGIYNPPSGASPSSTAPALLTKAASFRVEWYRIISPPLGTAFFRFVHKF